MKILLLLFFFGGSQWIAIFCGQKEVYIPARKNKNEALHGHETKNIQNVYFLSISSVCCQGACSAEQKKKRRKGTFHRRK